jgi:ribose-phosphate pyrophosphokinase
VSAEPIVFAFPGHDRLAAMIAAHIGGTTGSLFLHRFPDGEMYVRLDTPASGRQAVFVCTLNRPDAKVLPLLFAVAAAKSQGAVRAGMVAPYLAYLRQDTQFQTGEAVTSATFAALVSAAADWILTVDPHLHRYRSLDAVYSIPSRVVHAAPAISAWIARSVSKPLLIGPDRESEQWVQDVATGAHAPHVLLDKTRRGERDVEVTVPQLERYREHTPVLVDDIVATAQTMIAAVKHLVQAGLQAPVCVGVHAIFAGDAYEALQKAGAGRIVTCNTIAHASNGIDLDDAIAAEVAGLLSDTRAFA